VTQNDRGPTVHIVDDDPTIRALFERVATDSGWQLQTWSDGRTFLEHADLKAHGCLVLDLNLPAMTGHEVVEAMDSKDSAMPVIFMSGAAGVSDAVRAIQRGSLDFVEKPFGMSEMIAKIKTALQQDLAARAAVADLEDLRARFATLTPREHQVMMCVVRGFANKAAAAKLEIRPKTVEVHRSAVMVKTGADSVADLVRMAIRLGLLDDSADDDPDS